MASRHGKGASKGSTRALLGGLAVGCVIALAGLPASAEVVTWAFDGYVTHYAAVGVELDGSVVASADPAVATRFQGTITFDTDSPIVFSGPSGTLYALQAGAAFAYTLELGSYRFTNPSIGTATIADGTDVGGASPVDRLAVIVVGIEHDASSPPIAGDYTVDALIDFQTIEPDALASTALPGSPPADISTWGTRVFSFDLRTPTSDGVFMDGLVTSLRLLGANSAPVCTVPGPQSSPLGLFPVTFSAAGGNAISVADADAGSAGIEIAIGAANGRLTLASTTGLTFSEGDGFNDPAMTFRGTLADVNRALDGLRYTPNLLAFLLGGGGSVTITADDLGNTGEGGPLTDSDTVQLSGGL